MKTVCPLTILLLLSLNLVAKEKKAKVDVKVNMVVRMIDQHGKGIEGFKLSVQIHHNHPDQIPKSRKDRRGYLFTQRLESDAEGFIHIKDVSGFFLALSSHDVSKFYEWRAKFIKPLAEWEKAPKYTRESPYVIQMDRKGEGVELAKKTFRIKWQGDEKRVFKIDLIKGVVSQDGQLEVAIEKSQKTDTEYYKLIRMNLEGGGFVEKTERRVFIAPETGYKNHEHKAKLTHDGYHAGQTSLFFKVPHEDSFLYGRVYATESYRPKGTWNPVSQFILALALNPSGKRDTELGLKRPLRDFFPSGHKQLEIDLDKTKTE